MMKVFLNKLYAKLAIYFCLLMGILSPLKGWTDQPSLRDKGSKIFVAAKTLSEDDCYKYLDRNLLKKGYQPIQIIVKNNSDKTIVFSPGNIGSLSCVSVDEVIASARTSTAGRSAGYGVGSLFVLPLIIPAVVDGTKSAKANGVLEADYHFKAAKHQILPPNSKLNKLLFVQKGNYPKKFKVILTEEGSGKSYEKDVVINKFA